MNENKYIKYNLIFLSHFFNLTKQSLLYLITIVNNSCKLDVF